MHDDIPRLLSARHVFKSIPDFRQRVAPVNDRCKAPFSQHFFDKNHAPLLVERQGEEHPAPPQQRCEQRQERVLRPGAKFGGNINASGPEQAAAFPEGAFAHCIEDEGEWLVKRKLSA